MNRMADTVIKQKDEAEKVLELKIMKYQESKDQAAKQEDDRRQAALRVKNDELK